MKFDKLTISRPEDLVFGKAPRPVKTARGLEIGGGQVYTELNFTLPPMEVNPSTSDQVIKHYRHITEGALTRAVELRSPGVVLELETVIEMTRFPKIGIETVQVMNDICETFFHKFGLKSEIRLTPNDLRDFDKPPRQRNSPYLEPMLELFTEGARAGGNLLSIESTGGKEISDDSLMSCNLKTFIFSQAVLGVRDVRFLWKKIVEIARETNRLPGGDTACGFGNTAMVLAEKKYIPRVFAAAARAATVVRTLAAVEEGAMGPDKDCGYEGPFLKAIAGIPISMEGKTAACAHLSPLGNIAAACADLWSNESVQNIKLLAGMAPTIYLEQLEYDVRLMNRAIAKGDRAVQDFIELLVESDAHYDPQALILAPNNVIRIARQIVTAKNVVEGCVRGVKEALIIIKEAYQNGYLELNEMELPWLSMMQSDLEDIPDNEEAFIEQMLPVLDQKKIIMSEYGI